MIRGREGAPIECAGCGKSVSQETVSWVVTRMKRIDPVFPCEVCGKLYTMKRNAPLDTIEIYKSCTCDLKVSIEAIASCEPKIEKKYLVYCDECAKKVFPGVIFTEV